MTAFLCNQSEIPESATAGVVVNNMTLVFKFTLDFNGYRVKVLKCVRGWFVEAEVNGRDVVL